MKRFIAALMVGTLAVVTGYASPPTEARYVSQMAWADGSTANGLAGEWTGYFMNIAHVGDSRFIHGDYKLHVNEDGTYTGVRISRLVAGSTRGGQTKMSGTITARGRWLFLRDDAGWQMTLLREGTVFYGVNADPPSQWPILITLEEVSAKSAAVPSR